MTQWDPGVWEEVWIVADREPRRRRRRRKRKRKSGVKRGVDEV